MAQAGNFYHQLAKAQMRLSDIYGRAGNLAEAAKYADRALRSTRNSGIISALPIRMQFLATLRVRQGRHAEADLMYRRAEDQVDAQLALTPTGARHLLLKSTSDIYTEHFALVAEHRPSVSAAYGIIERVRGRILADLLRSGSLGKTGNLSRRTGDQRASIASGPRNFAGRNRPYTRCDLLRSPQAMDCGGTAVNHNGAPAGGSSTANLQPFSVT